MDVTVSLERERIKIPHADFNTLSFTKTPNGKFSFSTSKIYVLVGGGSAELSYLLTGWGKSSHAEIEVDGTAVSDKKLRTLSCYIGREHYSDAFPINKRLNVRRAIEKGLKKTRSALSYEDIRDKFNLTCERENRRLKYLGNENWRASLAIGFAYGKELYCANFIDSADWEKNHFPIILAPWLRLLKDEGRIIILPTNDEAKFFYIADEIIRL